MKERFRSQPENSKNKAPEAGAGPLGLPPPDPEQSPQGGGSQSPERQQLPNVWDVLEREVRIRLDDSLRMSSEVFDHELEEVYQLEEELMEKGTPREKLILDLSTAIRYEPAELPLTAWYRDLSLEEFQQFRSKVEPLSKEEIREALRKQKEENDRKLKEFFNGRRIFPPSNSAVSV